MDQLAYVEPGKWPTSEHLRVFEAFARDHIPAYSGYMDEPTQRRAIDWWNNLAPDASPEGVIEIKLPDLSRVALEPGDTLLVRVPRTVTSMDAAQICKKLQHHFPGHYVVVVPKELELSVVRPVPAKDGNDGSA